MENTNLEVAAQKARELEGQSSRKAILAEGRLVKQISEGPGYRKERGSAILPQFDDDGRTPENIRKKVEFQTVQIDENGMQTLLGSKMVNMDPATGTFEDIETSGGVSPVSSSAAAAASPGRRGKRKAPPAPELPAYRVELETAAGVMEMRARAVVPGASFVVLVSADSDPIVRIKSDCETPVTLRHGGKELRVFASGISYSWGGFLHQIFILA